MKTIHIPTAKAYDVIIERDSLRQAGQMIRSVCQKARSACIVTDDHVAPLYEKKLVIALTNAGFHVESIIIPHGEENKTVEVWHRVLEELCRARLTRTDVLVALGGGVTGDLGGFAAATYLRGIDFIQIPTTLLAMVDSSVGGKTAVDLSGGKNQVGAFWQPRMVICDTDTLKTLPEEEFQCGCAEIIKYAMIGNKELFESVRSLPIQNQLERVIATCVEMKREYVLEDEFDQGLRMMLNFGHTFGHACETCSRFSILHGQGVAMGMSIMARSACAQGILSKQDLEALIGLIKQYGLPTEAFWVAEELAEACLTDKKTSGGNIHIVVPEKIGSCKIETIRTQDLLRWLHLGGVA